MAKQTISWTALPNGFSDDGRSLRISLLVSPRLEPDAAGELLEFPDFVDWPATLARARFTVHFGAGPAVSIAGQDLAGPTRVDDTIGRADSDVWAALLPATTFVRGYAYRDLSQHSVLSFPASDIDALVRGLYTRLAASSSDQLPTAETYLNDSSWRGLLDAVARLDEQFVDRARDRKTGRLTAVRNPRRQFAAFKNHAFDKRDLASDLARFQLFHTPASEPRRERYDVPAEDAKSRAEWLGYERTEMPDAAEFQDRIDFHQIVAAMNQYPVLLRELGLVVDLLIRRDALTASPDALLWVEVELPPGDPAVERTPDASPRTHARLDAQRFHPVSRPAPQPGDFRVLDGLLDLDPATFRFVQSDVDGAGLKVTNFARTLLIQRGEPDHQTDPVTKQKRELGAPALRNAGLVLVHERRADMLKNSIARQEQFNDAAEKIRRGTTNPPAPPALYAEDLVRGYRVDVWDDVSRRVALALSPIGPIRDRRGRDRGRRRRGGRDGPSRCDDHSGPGEQSRYHLAPRDPRRMARLESLRARAGPDDRTRSPGSHRSRDRSRARGPSGHEADERVQGDARFVAPLAVRPRLLAAREGRRPRGQLAAGLGRGPRVREARRPCAAVSSLRTDLPSCHRARQAHAREGRGARRGRVDGADGHPQFQRHTQPQHRADTAARPSLRGRQSDHATRRGASRRARCGRHRRSRLLRHAGGEGRFPSRGEALDRGAARRRDSGRDPIRRPPRRRPASLYPRSSCRRDRGANLRPSGDLRSGHPPDPALSRHPVAGCPAVQDRDLRRPGSDAPVRRGDPDAARAAAQGGPVHASPERGSERRSAPPPRDLELADARTARPDSHRRQPDDVPGEAGSPRSALDAHTVAKHRARACGPAAAHHARTLEVRRRARGRIDVRPAELPVELQHPEHGPDGPAGQLE